MHLRLQHHEELRQRADLGFHPLPVNCHFLQVRPLGGQDGIQGVPMVHPMVLPIYYEEPNVDKRTEELLSGSPTPTFAYLTRQNESY